MHDNIKYPFALDKDNKMIGITDAARSDCFTCVFCGNKMIAKKVKYIHIISHIQANAPKHGIMIQ